MKASRKPVREFYDLSKRTRWYIRVIGHAKYMDEKVTGEQREEKATSSGRGE